MNVTHKKASEVFGINDKELNFDVPVFDEKTDNVPEIDPNYKFRTEYLVPVLWAITKNKKAWLSGHTGTGKSTLIAQVCAHLNYPLVRVNFDSEISRMDLVGRDVLKRDENGATVSTFIDGILPQALQQPCVLLCDEVDFIRPDVAYVFQRALEDEGLLISEDGGRLVKPHEHFRIVATANTQGQGDDFGIYQGARAQSIAFLDRFTVWVKCDYLKSGEEQRLIQEIVPEINLWALEQVMTYVKEHRQAFDDLKVSQPLSPRTVITLAEATMFYYDKAKKPLLRAAQDGILGKCNSADRTTIVGILDRVAKDKPASASKGKKSKESSVDSKEMEKAKKQIEAMLKSA